MIRRLAFAVVLWLAGLGSALAQYVTPVQMRDANLTTTNVQNYITTLSTFTLPRTLTIPPRSSLNAYYIQFVDTAGAINGSNTLTIQVADGSLINGQSSLVLTIPNTYVFFAPSAGGYSASIVYQTSGSGIVGGTSGQIQYNNAGAFGGFTTSGDATINTTTGALTLATVNTNTGTWGGAAFCSAFTTNAKGLITAAAQSACTPAIANVTGLGSGVATALANPLNATSGIVGFNGNVGATTAASVNGLIITPTLGTLTIPNNASAVLEQTGNFLLNLTATGATTPIFPAGTHTLAGLDVAQSWLATQTYPAGTIQYSGSTSGNTILNASAVASGTLTLPAANDTLVARSTADTLANKIINASNNTLTLRQATVQKFTSGTSLTYTTPVSSSYSIVKFCGGGGGGSGSGTGTSGGVGGNGGPTIFNGITAPGGSGATASNPGAGGGAVTGGSPVETWVGAQGGGVQTGVAGNFLNGGTGGNSVLFGGGGGTTGVPNTGAGGAGGIFNGAGNTGGGGGSGSCAIAIVPGGGATYTYTVGSAGTLGTAGTSGNAGTAGSNGYIEAVEF